MVKETQEKINGACAAVACVAEITMILSAACVDYSNTSGGAWVVCYGSAAAMAAAILVAVVSKLSAGSRRRRRDKRCLGYVRLCNGKVCYDKTRR